MVFPPDALADNGSQPALSLLFEMIMDPRHSEEEKVAWMRDAILRHRQAPDVLQMADALLKGALAPELKTELVAALFTYDLVRRLEMVPERRRRGELERALAQAVADPAGGLRPFYVDADLVDPDWAPAADLLDLIEVGGAVLEPLPAREPLVFRVAVP